LSFFPPWKRLIRRRPFPVSPSSKTLGNRLSILRLLKKLVAFSAVPPTFHLRLKGSDFFLVSHVPKASVSPQWFDLASLHSQRGFLSRVPLNGALLSADIRLSPVSRDGSLPRAPSLFSTFFSPTLVRSLFRPFPPGEGPIPSNGAWCGFTQTLRCGSSFFSNSSPHGACLSPYRVRHQHTPHYSFINFYVARSRNAASSSAPY